MFAVCKIDHPSINTLTSSLDNENYQINWIPTSVLIKLEHDVCYHIMMA